MTPPQFFWRDYSQQPYQSLILTLNSYQALSLLAFLGAFIAYAQTKWWIISRYLLIRTLHPIRLPDSDDLESLHHLTQAKAIKQLIFRQRPQNNSPTTVSKWFGVLSVFNVLLFIVLGSIIPYLLAGGSGTATVQSQAINACDGFNSYSTDAVELSYAFYTQCTLNTTAESRCGFAPRMPNNRPEVNVTLDPQCPFTENGCKKACIGSFCSRLEPCVCGRFFDTAYRIEFLDMRLSEYGLNADSRIRQSHSLTCVPLPVYRIQIPINTHRSNATVFWVGYDSYQIKKNETWASVGESFKYWPQTLIQPAPFKWDSGVVYDLKVYPGNENYKSTAIFENFAPGLKADDGDLFIVMLKNSVGPPTEKLVYLPWREGLMKHGGDSIFNTLGFSAGALGCFEQYRLCFDKTCTGWSNSSTAVTTLSDMLQLDFKTLSGTELLKVLRTQELLQDASSVRRFLAHNHRYPVLIRSMKAFLPQFAEFHRDRPDEQWHWEVRSWFELSFLITKFSLFASVQGVNNTSRYPDDHFRYTDWICSQVLLLDDNYTNVNFIGLMATFAGLLMLCLLSLAETIVVWIRGGKKVCWKLCQRVGVVLKRLWNALLHDIALVYRQIQRILNKAGDSVKELLQAMRTKIGTAAETIGLHHLSRLVRPRPRFLYGEEFDEDINMPPI